MESLDNIIIENEKTASPLTDFLAGARRANEQTMNFVADPSRYLTEATNPRNEYLRSVENLRRDLARQGIDLEDVIKSHEENIFVPEQNVGTKGMRLLKKRIMNNPEANILTKASSLDDKIVENEKVALFGMYTKDPDQELRDIAEMQQDKLKQKTMGDLAKTKALQKLVNSGMINDKQDLMAAMRALEMK